MTESPEQDGPTRNNRPGTGRTDGVGMHVPTAERPGLPPLTARERASTQQCAAR
ncbi:hypothetical protein [Streptomyces sp. NPDC049879]|uniref:hypothetical protein n=1 Tax=Streptomyces sp. NPDC049879 TaxID=3365598 RepID=UPI0037A1BE62